MMRDLVMMVKLAPTFAVGLLAFAGMLPDMAWGDEVGGEEVVVAEEPPPPAEPAAAAEDDKRGPFFGIGVTYSQSQFPSLSTPTGGDYDNTMGFNLRGGYRFMKYIAVEGVLEYNNQFNATSSYPDTNFPDRTATLNSDIWTIGFWTNAKAILPLGAVEPYVSGGVGLLYANELAIGQVWQQAEGATEPTQVKVSTSNDPVVFAGRVAGGVDYALTKKVGLFAEASYALPTSDLSSFNYIAVHFGARLTF